MVESVRIRFPEGHAASQEAHRLSTVVGLRGGSAPPASAAAVVAAHRGQSQQASHKHWIAADLHEWNAKWNIPEAVREAHRAAAQAHREAAMIHHDFHEEVGGSADSGDSGARLATKVLPQRTKAIPRHLQEAAHAASQNAYQASAAIDSMFTYRYTTNFAAHAASANGNSAEAAKYHRAAAKWHGYSAKQSPQDAQAHLSAAAAHEEAAAIHHDLHEEYGDSGARPTTKALPQRTKAADEPDHHEEAMAASHRAREATHGVYPPGEADIMDARGYASSAHSYARNRPNFAAILHERVADIHRRAGHDATANAHEAAAKLHRARRPARFPEGYAASQEALTRSRTAGPAHYCTTQAADAAFAGNSEEAAECHRVAADYHRRHADKDDPAHQAAIAAHEEAAAIHHDFHEETKSLRSATKAMSWLDSSSGGALVPPAKQPRAGWSSPLRNRPSLLDRLTKRSWSPLFRTKAITPEELEEEQQQHSLGLAMGRLVDQYSLPRTRDSRPDANDRRAKKRREGFEEGYSQERQRISPPPGEPDGKALPQRTKAADEPDHHEEAIAASDRALQATHGVYPSFRDDAYGARSDARHAHVQARYDRPNLAAFYHGGVASIHRREGHDAAADAHEAAAKLHRARRPARFPEGYAASQEALTRSASTGREYYLSIEAADAAFAGNSKDAAYCHRRAAGYHRTHANRDTPAHRAAAAAHDEAAAIHHDFHEETKSLRSARGKRLGRQSTKEFREADHPRGQPDNPGQFVEKDNGSPGGTPGESASGEGGSREGGSREGGSGRAVPPAGDTKPAGAKPASKKFGKSKAAVTVDSGQDPKKIQKALAALVGKGTTLADLPSLVGAPDDAAVTVATKGKDVLIRIDHPAFAQPCVRKIVYQGKGLAPYIKNEIIDIKPSEQGKGLGSEIFGRQVENLREHGGFSHIECHAARLDSQGSERFNGYYTWPVLGYNAYFDDFAGDGPLQAKTADAVARAFPGVESVLELTATREGRAWWKANGCDLHECKFSLKDGSPSLLRFEAYLAERAARPSQGN